MLLPIFVADVIATYLAQCGGRCYCQVAGRRSTVGWVDMLPDESICLKCMFHMNVYQTYEVCKMCILYRL